MTGPELTSCIWSSSIRAIRLGALPNSRGHLPSPARTVVSDTFAHELGHNMGLRHDRYAQLYSEFYRGPVTPDPAFGYVNQRAFTAGAARSSRWKTIMAYHTQCSDAYSSCERILRFSNSRQTYNGDPLGIPFGEGSGLTGPADAAAVLNATGPCRGCVARSRAPFQPASEHVGNPAGPEPDVGPRPGGEGTAGFRRS